MLCFFVFVLYVSLTFRYHFVNVSLSFSNLDYRYGIVSLSSWSFCYRSVEVSLTFFINVLVSFNYHFVNVSHFVNLLLAFRYHFIIVTSSFANVLLTFRYHFIVSLSIHDRFFIILPSFHYRLPRIVVISLFRYNFVNIYKRFVIVSLSFRYGFVLFIV